MLAQESAARQIVFGKRWLVLSAFVIFAAILGSIAPARSLAIVLQAASATVGLAVLVNFVVALRRQRGGGAQEQGHEQNKYRTGGKGGNHDGLRRQV